MTPVLYGPRKRTLSFWPCSRRHDRAPNERVGIVDRRRSCSLDAAERNARRTLHRFALSRSQFPGFRRRSIRATLACRPNVKSLPPDQRQPFRVRYTLCLDCDVSPVTGNACMASAPLMTSTPPDNSALTIPARTPSASTPKKKKPNALPEAERVTSKLDSAADPVIMGPSVETCSMTY